MSPGLCSTYSTNWTPRIHELTHVLEDMVERRGAARRLRTHPGVGPLTAFALSYRDRVAMNLLLQLLRG